MNKYEIRTEQKKSAIIHAALELINKKGFANASIKEIAALANVSQVSIYNYFGSKDALAIECAKLVVNDNFQKARDLLHTEVDFKEKLLSALSICSSQINHSMSEYFSVSTLADKNFISLLTDGINDLKREVYLEYIEAGKKENVIDPSIPTSTILKFVDSFNTIEIDAHDYNTEVEAIHHLFLYGVLGK